MKNLLFFVLNMILITHFLWIIFVIIMFVLTLYSVIKKYRKFLNLKWLRILHLLGIVYVTGLEILGKYCPLTVLEINLRNKLGLENYSGSFIIHYLEKIIYPEVSPTIIIIPTIIIAGITLLSFLFYPPKF